MPNHCTNNLTVKGSDAELKRFTSIIKGYDHDNDKDTPFTFHSLIPMPVELTDVHSGGNTIDGEYVHLWWERDGKSIKIPQGTLDRWIKDFGATSWYDWTNSHWGTKWDCYDVELTVRKASLLLTFTTAWAPPEPVIREMIRRFPRLDFHLDWNEEGGQYGIMDSSMERDDDDLDAKPAPKRKAKAKRPKVKTKPKSKPRRKVTA